MNIFEHIESVSAAITIIGGAIIALIFKFKKGGK